CCCNSAGMFVTSNVTGPTPPSGRSWTSLHHHRLLVGLGDGSERVWEFVQQVRQVGLVQAERSRESFEFGHRGIDATVFYPPQVLKSDFGAGTDRFEGQLLVEAGEFEAEHWYPLSVDQRSYKTRAP